MERRMTTLVCLFRTTAERCGRHDGARGDAAPGTALRAIAAAGVAAAMVACSAPCGYPTVAVRIDKRDYVARHPEACPRADGGDVVTCPCPPPRDAKAYCSEVDAASRPPALREGCSRVSLSKYAGGEFVASLSDSTSCAYRIVLSECYE